MALNLEIVERAIKQIEALEEIRSQHCGTGVSFANTKGDCWVQDDWRYVGECGTAMCLAGWINTLDCGEWIEKSSFLIARKDEPGTYTTTRCDRVVTAERRAMNVTGISRQDADYLFSSGRTIQDMKDWVEEQREAQ